MPRSHYKITGVASPHFLTVTINNWLRLFTRPSAVQIVLDSWAYLREQSGFRLHGDVILEHHLHLIATSPELAHDMQRLKSWTAREILLLLERQSSKRMLELFALCKRRHKIQSDYQVWEEGSHPQLIGSEEMMR